MNKDLYWFSIYFRDTFVVVDKKIYAWPEELNSAVNQLILEYLVRFNEIPNSITVVRSENQGVPGFRITFR